MRCEDFAQQLEAWLDGELSAADAAACEMHRAACPHCAEAVVARRGLRTALQGLAAQQPPAALRAAILSAAAESAAPARRWRPLGATALVAAALVLIALGLRDRLGGDAREGGRGAAVLAYLDGAFEEFGVIRAGELTLTVGPGARCAPARSDSEGGKQ
ncbi:hypothetical protein FJ251_01720 [bacterium]|nr:hypothetical protein [bacterium]